MESQEKENCCKYCGKSGFKKLGNHEAQCKLNPNRSFIGKNLHLKCFYCNKEFKTEFYLNSHIKSCHKQELRIKQVNEEFYCRYCNRKFTLKNSGSFHEKYCKENPNKEIYKGHFVPPELRKQISEKQKENYKNGKSRWNIDRSQNSYAEQYFIDWLNTFTDYRHNYWTNRYYLDFAWPDKMIYFEVNGQQHYQKDVNGRDYRERDIERFENLKNDGWTCLAIIKWSWYKSLSTSDQKLYLENLKNSILNSEVLNCTYKSRKELREEKRLEKIKEANSCGLIDKNNHINYFKTPDYIWVQRKDIILSSNVNLMKYGYLTKLVNETGLSRKIIQNTIKKFNIEHYITKN